ncbi:hypothetical protein HanXRQr2_Chr06g0255061 [Helianthus annuus]|uniref:Uncharacterized protein n=1 Tax=Helianthus annuus TaxID=4232 RepID=A0A9K3IS17_HELAN|nr:hypothetical protein HanXRQr2_Chr06g0255061 [Helianthus annuus]KAJ0915107.1 hypothetical protein HanPSC8_Chr06g0246151 [Helianthus annuus]
MLLSQTPTPLHPRISPATTIWWWRTAAQRNKNRRRRERVSTKRRERESVGDERRRRSWRRQWRRWRSRQSITLKTSDFGSFGSHFGTKFLWFKFRLGFGSGLGLGSDYTVNGSQLRCGADSRFSRVGSGLGQPRLNMLKDGQR